MSESAARHLPLLALTGGIASGKSAVADLFRGHGALVLSADLVGRELLEPGAPGWLILHEEFGGHFDDVSGRLDRGALRRAIFGDAGLRARVDSLLHPLIRMRIAELVAGAEGAVLPIPTLRPTFAGTVVEVPLLYEVGWQSDFACVVVVWADHRQALARLMARDHVDQAAAEAAIAAQLPLAEKIARADMVIDNRGDLRDTARQVAQLIERLTAGAACRLGLRNSSPST